MTVFNLGAFKALALGWREKVSESRNRNTNRSVGLKTETRR